MTASEFAAIVSRYLPAQWGPVTSDPDGYSVRTRGVKVSWDGRWHVPGGEGATLPEAILAALYRRQ